MAVVFFVGCAKEPATARAVAPGALESSGTVMGGDGTDGHGGSDSVRGGVGDRAGAGSAGGAAGAGAQGARSGDGSDWRSSGGARGDARAAGQVGGRGGVGSSTAAGGGTGDARGAGAAGAAGTARGAAAAGGAAGTAGAAGSAGAGGAGQSGQSGAALRPEPREFTAVAGLEDIHFDFDRYDVQADAAKALAANAEWLRSHPGDLVLIEGHCDDRGTNEYNLALGHHRAESTMNYLIAQGVQSSRITVISYGEERPLCAEPTEACWEKNRRAHFLVKHR